MLLGTEERLQDFHSQVNSVSSKLQSSVLASIHSLYSYTLSCIGSNSIKEAYKLNITPLFNRQRKTKPNNYL